jgi:PilZ domain-containing protein
MEQRKYVRYPVEYTGSFSGDTISAQGVILDLSSVGCKARSTVAVEKGAFVGVLIDVPRYATPLQVALAVVRWSHGREFGLEFIQMQPDDQQRLREVIRATEAARAIHKDHGA